MVDFGNIQSVHVRLLLEDPRCEHTSFPNPSTQMDLSRFIWSNHYKDPRDDLLKLSTSLVFDFLGYFLNNLEGLHVQLYENPDQDQESTYLFKNQPATGTSLCHRTIETNQLYRSLRDRGWCPSRLTFLFARLDIPALLILSQIEAPPSSKKHTTSTSQPYTHVSTSQNLQPKTPDHCDPHHCAVLTVDEKTYKTKHVEGCSRCLDVTADLGEVLNILRTGAIPLIRAIKDDDQSTAVKLIPSTSQTKYTAISHVWSDGLGNVDRAALPRCQLLRLSNLVRNAQMESDYLTTRKPRREVLFWLDTICCPPDPAHQDEARRLAIQRMASTYREASETLVLDSWLCSASIQGMMNHEIRLRILCCNWNSRLWTLQEAAITKGRILFQFDDAVYDWGREAVCSSSFPIDSPTPIENAEVIKWDFALLRSISRMERDLLEFGREVTVADKIHHATNALQFRSTSVAADEPLCLSNLLNLNSAARKAILRTKPERRMERLWSEINTVPSAILCGDWPRLSQDGFWWAPQSLLGGAENDFLVPYEPGLPDDRPQVTINGLTCQRQGYVFRVGQFLVGHQFTIADESKTVYSLSLNIENVKGSVPYTSAMYSQRPDAPKDSRCLDLYQLYQSEELAFINFEREMRMRMRMKGNRVLIDRIRKPEIEGFVARVKESADVIFVQRLCAASLARLTKTEEQIKNLPFETTAFSPTTLLSFTRATSKPTSQKWCID